MEEAGDLSQFSVSQQESGQKGAVLDNATDIKVGSNLLITKSIAWIKSEFQYISTTYNQCKVSESNVTVSQSS